MKKKEKKPRRCRLRNSLPASSVHPHKKWAHLSASPVVRLSIHPEVSSESKTRLDLGSPPLRAEPHSCPRRLFSRCESTIAGLCLKNDSHTSSPASVKCWNLLSCVIPPRLSAHLCNCREEEMKCWSWQSVGNLCSWLTPPLRYPEEMNGLHLLLLSRKMAWQRPGWALLLILGWLG